MHFASQALYPGAAYRTADQPDQERNDQGIGKTDIFGHGQHGKWHGTGKKAGFAPARRGIQAQGSAKQQCQGGIRHGVGVHGGWGARRNHAEKERQKKARSKHQHSTRPVFARHGCRRGNAGQEQNIQPGQALPFIKLARYALEEIGNQAGCRVSKARRQVDGIRHIQRSALRHHLGGKAPGGKFIPLGKHGLLQSKQHPQKAAAAHKQQKAGAEQRPPDSPPPGTHPKVDPAGQPDRHDDKMAELQKPQQGKQIQHHGRPAQGGQRQQGGIEPGACRHAQTACGEEQQKQQAEYNLHGTAPPGIRIKLVISNESLAVDCRPVGGLENWGKVAYKG